MKSEILQIVENSKGKWDSFFLNLKIVRKKKAMNDRLKINYKTEMITFLWASFESRFEQIA